MIKRALIDKAGRIGYEPRASPAEGIHKVVERQNEEVIGGSIRVSWMKQAPALLLSQRVWRRPRGTCDAPLFSTGVLQDKIRRSIELGLSTIVKAVEALVD